MTDKTTDPEIILEDDLELPMDVDILEAKKEDDTVEKVEEEDPIAVLQRQLDEAKADAARAAQEAQEARKQAKEYEARVQHSNGQTLASQLDSVESAMQFTRSRADNAKRAYAAALEIADYDAAAKAQEELTAATYDMRTLESGKAELTHRKKLAAEPQRQAQPEGVDGMIDGILQASSREASDYVRRNREHLKSERDVKKMIAAHQLAILDHQPDTESYFKAIDKQMGWGQVEEPVRAAPTAQKKTVSAPPARSTARANGDLSENKVTLTPAERQFCDETGTSYQAYAKNKLAIARNGKDPNANGLRFTADIRS